MKNSQGFTLVELLVVIFIIGFLTAIIMPNFLSSRQRGRDASRKQDLLAIKNALRMYYNDHQSYPNTTLTAPLVTDHQYMRALPADPLSTAYGYCYSSDLEQFRLWASLENPADGDITASQTACPSLTGETCTASCVQRCYYVCAY